jgi:hypothetical protein
VIFVTRDPRGVVASRIQAGWGASIPELLAARWRLDQQEAIRAMRLVSPDQYLLVRYEDAVEDPERMRSGIGRSLGVEPAPAGTSWQGSGLFPAWETWKERAVGPITSDRAQAWESELTATQAASVLKLCRQEMVQFGYEPGSNPSPLPTAPSIRLRIGRMRLSRLQERIWIGRQHL